MSRVYNPTGHSLKIPNMVDSEGVYLFDEHGKKYMDLESGVWCTCLGHNHKRINSVITERITSVMHAGFCYSSRILQEAAEAVLSITGFDDGKCVFLSSGSEAIELARQAARHVTGRNRSMTLHDSYLGSYATVTDRSKNWYVFDWRDCAVCPDAENCRPECDKLASIPEDIADFVFEPGSSSGFVRFPPRSLIRNIAAAVRSGGGKIIANEVTTGIGRTGKWFGYNHYGIKPDMVAMGKGVGNGFPVSVTAIEGNTVEELEKSGFKYAQSHQNDPLGAAVVKEVIAVIKEEELISKAAKKGDVFFKMLKELKDGQTITDVRARGLMMALDICDAPTGTKLFDALISRGYIVGNRQALFRIDPPLTISVEEFGLFADEFRDILARDRRAT